MRRFSVSLFLVLAGTLLEIWESDAYSCKSSSGADVDWFYAYKLPDLEKGSNPSDGTSYIYVDANTVDEGWTQSSEAVDNPKSSIGRTVSQIFDVKKKESDFYALYNDEDANSNHTEFGRGHMKGVLIFNDFEGIWIVHSVPRYPSTLSNSYSYPHSGKRYGQSFLCVTFPTHILNDIGTQLQFGQPSVYEKRLPDSYARLYPNLAAALGRKSSRLPKKSTVYSSVKQISSVKGVQFTSFSKSTKYGKDLYNDLVAPQLSTSLYVETWLNGGNDLPSDCGASYQVYNLRSVKPFKSSFNTSKDHSKWAVSTDAKDAWICIGDINRQSTQYRRGGGTLCSRNSKISTLFRLAVGDVECCKSTGDNSTNTTKSNSIGTKMLSKAKGFFKQIFGFGGTANNNSTNDNDTCIVYQPKKKRKRARNNNRNGKC